MPFLSTQELTIPANADTEPEWHTSVWIAAGIAGGLLLGVAIAAAAGAALCGSAS